MGSERDVEKKLRKMMVRQSIQVPFFSGSSCLPACLSHISATLIRSICLDGHVCGGGRNAWWYVSLWVEGSVPMLSCHYEENDRQRLGKAQLTSFSV